MKRIAVILVDWNGIEVTLPCLESLNALKLSDNFTIELIVVDNGSAIPIADRIKNEYSDVVVFRSEENRGFAAGCNIGIRYAIESGIDYSLLLNNDTTVEPDFVSHLFDSIEGNPTVGLAQPKILFQHDKNLIWNAGNRFNKWIGLTSTNGYGEKNSNKYDSITTMPWATGCCMLINNKLFTGEGLGLLNETYETYYEDVEFSFRVREKGYRISYVPSSIIYHIAGYSVNSNQETQEGRTHPFVVYLHSRNRIFLLREFFTWYTCPTVLLFQMVYYALLMLRFLLLRRPKKLNAVLRSIFDGISNSYDSMNRSFSSPIVRC
jgi:GT2 family glycosyltransferase